MDWVFNGLPIHSLLVHFTVVVIPVAALVVVAKARAGSGFLARRGVRIGVTVVLLTAVLVTSVGSIVTVVRIGEAGTAAVWDGKLDN